MEKTDTNKEDGVVTQNGAAETVDDKESMRTCPTEQPVSELGSAVPASEMNEAMKFKESGQERCSEVGPSKPSEIKCGQEDGRSCSSQSEAVETAAIAPQVHDAVEAKESEEHCRDTRTEAMGKEDDKQSCPSQAVEAVVVSPEASDAVKTRESKQKDTQSCHSQVMAVETTEVAAEEEEAMDMRESEQEDRQSCPAQTESMETVMAPPKGSDTVETTESDQKGSGSQSKAVETAVIASECSDAVEMSESEPDQRGTGNEDSVEVSPLSGGGGSLALLSMQYRDDGSDMTDSDTDSSDSSSTSSSSSSSSSDPIAMVRKELNQAEDEDGDLPLGKKPAPVRTQDELLIEDLPAVENLTISLPENTEIEAVGVISSIVDQLVIIESKKDSPPLNDDSVLFNKNRLAVGRVFEVFGPVCQPFYILRFNSQEEIQQRDLRIRDPVFFAPKVKDFTEYIFTEQLNQFKGSDASWKNDQEPPPEALDFSDDEQERQAKQKLKEQKRHQHSRNESDSDSEPPARRPPPSQPPSRRKQRSNWNPQRGGPTHHNASGGFHRNYHTNPHFQPHSNPPSHPDYMYPPPAPYQPPFQNPGYPNYPRPPPPHMGMGPWAPPPYPGFMFPFPPPPPPPPPPPSN